MSSPQPLSLLLNVLAWVVGCAVTIFRFLRAVLCCYCVRNGGEHRKSFALLPLSHIEEHKAPQLLRLIDARFLSPRNDDMRFQSIIYLDAYSEHRLRALLRVHFPHLVDAAMPTEKMHCIGKVMVEVRSQIHDKSNIESVFVRQKCQEDYRILLPSSLKRFENVESDYGLSNSNSDEDDDVSIKSFSSINTDISDHGRENDNINENDGEKTPLTAALTHQKHQNRQCHRTLKTRHQQQTTTVTQRPTQRLKTAPIATLKTSHSAYSVRSGSIGH